MSAVYKHKRQQIDLIGELHFLRKYLDGNLHIFHYILSRAGRREEKELVGKKIT